MVSKKILGLIAIILGIVLIVASFYIKGKVSEGRKQISETEGYVKQGSKLFSLSPVTKDIGKEVSGQAQKKLDEASLKADKYNKMAVWFQIGGIIFIAIGAVVVVVSYKKK